MNDNNIFGVCELRHHMETRSRVGITLFSHLGLRQVRAPTGWPNRVEAHGVVCSPISLS